MHPSQNIKNEEKEISELSKIDSSPLFNWNTNDKTCMIVWKKLE